MTANYDAWLEAPYQQSYAFGDALADWCEAEGIDPDAPDAQDLYEQHLEALAEDAALAAAEDRAERLAEDRWDR